MRSYLAIVGLIALAAAPVAAQDWREGFEPGLGSAKPYTPDEGTTLELARDRAAEGQQYLRALVPGKRALEGANVTATGLSGGRVATVSARVRGKGNLWLCLISGNGWLYSPQTFALTDQWQLVTLSKTLLATDKGLGIHFLSQTAQPGAVFEVDDVRVALAAAPVVYDAAVGPWRLEAENYPRLERYVVEDAEASGGKALQADAYLSTAELPFPRTSRPVTVYLRVKAASPKETWNLETRQTGLAEYVSVARPPQAGGWQWLALPPRMTGDVGNAFSICCLVDKAVGGPVWLDQIVLSTREKLTDAELAQARPLALSGPRAVVARTAAAPVLDGKDDDACWRQTVACSDFLSLGLSTLAEAPTTVRLCYDDRNLYLHFTCREPILNVAGQRRSEFAAKVTERDGQVYADDSAVVLLDPANTGKQVYDFTVNALGTIADARCPGPNLWDSRDLQWNSAAQAKGLIGEDVWTLELAIPFSDLGGVPRPGDAWQASLGRLAKARKEVSSWNPSKAGFHDPAQLGTLVFGETTPGVLLGTPAALQMGKNPLSLTLAAPGGQPAGAYLMVATAAAQAKSRSDQYLFVPAPEKPGAVVSDFEARTEGEVRMQYAVLDAATLTPWYASPMLTRVARTSVAQVSLACDGPYELYLNDEVISRGAKAPAEALKAALQTGANVFALKVEQGTAAIRVQAPGAQFTGETWKAAPAETKDATKAGLDDRAWAVAKQTGTHPQLGSVVGEAGKPTVLRRTLLWEKTRIWPTPDPAFYLARGPAQHITVRTEGLPGKRLEGWTTYLATPPDYEILGSTGFYGSTSPDQPKFTCTQLGLRRVNGREMRVTQVQADKPLMAGRHFIMSEFEAFVRYREAAGEPKSPEAEFVYWSEANGGNVSEPPQSFKVRLLPKLDGRQPKQVALQLWGGWLSNMDDYGLREEVLRCAQAAGFNDLVDHDRWTSDTGKQYGLALTLTTNFRPWEMNLAPHLKEHPDQRLVGFDGKPSDDLMCMSQLLGDGWPTVETALKLRLDAIKPRTVDIDFEYGPKTGPHSCYCPRCLAAFREFAKLPADAALDPATIYAKYEDQWVDFMARRVAEMFAKFKTAVHRLAPGTEFSVYSGYQVPDNPKMYGINWQYIGDLQACDRAAAGYGEPEAAMWHTVEVLKGIPLLPGALVTPYERAETVPVTPLTRTGLLRLLFAGNGGVLVYDRCSFDGRCWAAVADMSRVAAAHEDVFLKGPQATALPGFQVTQVQVRGYGGTTLVCALNPTGKAVEYTLQLPAGAGAGTEFYSGRKVSAGETVKCALGPGDAAVYVLRR